MQPREHAETFLDRLFSGTKGFINTKALLGRKAARQFFDVRWPADAIDYLFNFNASGYGAFVGVNPTHTQGGTEKDVAYVRSLYLDLDCNKGVDAEANLSKLQRFGLDPSIIVWSGNGVHFYFLLSDPLPCPQGKLLGQRLCYATDSDAVFNVNRIARLPGTANWKDGEPKSCYLSHLSSRDYGSAEIMSALDRMGVPRVEPKPDGAPVMQNEDPLFNWTHLKQRLPAASADLIENGIPHEHYRSRSENDFRVVKDLVLAGATNEQIEWIYANKEIGALKYKEKGIRYLHQTIKSARRALTGPAKLRRSRPLGERFSAFSRGGFAPLH